MRIYKIKIKKVNYGITFMPKGFWLDCWKPVWHEGRGYYISIGMWLIGVYRGY